MASSNPLLREIKYFLWWLPDRQYLQIYYYLKYKRFIDFKHPKSFNEKLQWLKLFDRKEKYTALVDKVEVKKYVADIIGEEHIIPTIAVWDDPKEINFDNLPDQFVLKCNHDSGEVFICKNKEKLNKKAVVNRFRKLIKKDYFYIGREWPYKKVKRKVFAECYIKNNSCDIDKMNPDGNDELSDYKFMCFNGEVKCIFTCTERNSIDGLKVTFFDRDWNILPFERGFPKSKKPIKKPINLNQMIEIAEKLSSDIPFVRVDLYEGDEEILFGELTFFPGNGFEKFEPEEWDYTLGDWINLDQVHV